MNVWQAIHSFWGGFELPAYDESGVPDDATEPYITYSAAIDTFDSPVVLTGDLWYKGTSWEDISLKAEEIKKYLANGGVTIPVDDGRVWITQGSPFAQRMDENSDIIRHVYIVLMVEFMTN